MANSYNNTDVWDGKFTSGDDLNYALGLTKDRVLVKGSDLTPSGGLKWTGTGINRTLGINLLSGCDWLSLEEDDGLVFMVGDVSFTAAPKQEDDDALFLYGSGSGIGPRKGAIWQISIPYASSTNGGVIGTGYTLNSKNYPLLITSDGNGYVNVPWETAVSIVPISGSNFSANIFQASETVHIDATNKNTATFSVPTAAGLLGVVKTLGEVNPTTAEVVKYFTLFYVMNYAGSLGTLVAPYARVEDGTYHAGIMSANDKHDLDAVIYYAQAIRNGKGAVIWDVNDELTLNSTVAGEGLNLNNGVLGIATGDGIQLFDTNKRIRVRIPNESASTGLYFKGSTTNEKELDVRTATSTQVGVTKLYTSVTSSSDTNTDGAVTQAALHTAYNNIMTAIGDLEGVEFKIAGSLPAANSSMKKYIYLIPISGASSPDAYEEYVCINKGTASSPSWTWEKIGDTNIDLSDYVKVTDTLGKANVDSIVTAVFGF